MLHDSALYITTIDIDIVMQITSKPYVLITCW